MDHNETWATKPWATKPLFPKESDCCGKFRTLPLSFLSRGVWRSPKSPPSALTMAGTRLGEAFRVGELRLHSQPVLRVFFAFVAVASAIVLAGCDTESAVGVNGRHMQPLSERMLAELERRKMAKESPILVRIFKEESEL